MKYRFLNNGKPYEISIGTISDTIKIEFSDGNMHVYDDDILAIQLLSEETVSGIIFKKTSLQYRISVEYKLTTFGRPSTQIISVHPKEVQSAKEACEKANIILAQIKKAKAAYNKEQDEKLKQARQKDTIDAIDATGKPIKIWRREIFFGESVLVADGGEAYHTHADCFESWKPMYRRTFSHWKIIKKSDAISQGLTECKLCQKYYDAEDDE